MSKRGVLVAVTALGLVLGVASTAITAQEVAKRTAKRAAKEATESAAKQKAEDVTKKAVKKAMAPDAVDLNTATPEQLAKLGLDEATAGKIVAARPFTSIEDPKIKEAIPADALAKLQGKITVKPADPASAPPATPAAIQPTSPPNPQ